MATSKKSRKKNAAASVRAAETQTSVATADQTEAELAAEYAYVRRDLRHLAVVSVVLFAVMLGIGFFI